MNLKVLSCAIFENEVRAVASESKHNLDLSFIELDKCHEKITQGKVVLQDLVDQYSAENWDAILVGYGLCGRLMTDIQARNLPLVVPRTHDCLGVLFGSRQKYLDFFMNNPGTYYLSKGWIEHAESKGGDLVNQMQMGEMSYEFEGLVKQYGEDNAQYLYEVMGNWQSHYNKAAVIVQSHDNETDLIANAERLASPKGWQVQPVQGDTNLIKRWLNGDWDSDDFLVVKPGQVVTESNDDLILEAVSP